jgi:hypothetical protein
MGRPTQGPGSMARVTTMPLRSVRLKLEPGGSRDDSRSRPKRRLNPTLMTPEISPRASRKGYPKKKVGFEVDRLVTYSPEERCPVASAPRKWRRSAMLKRPGFADAHTSPAASAMEMLV